MNLRTVGQIYFFIFFDLLFSLYLLRSLNNKSCPVSVNFPFIFPPPLTHPHLLNSLLSDNKTHIFKTKQFYRFTQIITPALKGVFAKNERGYTLTAKNKRFLSLLILLLSILPIVIDFFSTY